MYSVEGVEFSPPPLYPFCESYVDIRKILKEKNPRDFFSVECLPVQDEARLAFDVDFFPLMEKLPTSNDIPVILKWILTPFRTHILNFTLL